ncbi:hypothetical protein EMMF5_002111 [Cystobasidiomycetes sp. EMM_F5]
MRPPSHGNVLGGENRAGNMAVDTVDTIPGEVMYTIVVIISHRLDRVPIVHHVEAKQHAHQLTSEVILCDNLDTPILAQANSYLLATTTVKMKIYIKLWNPPFVLF